MAAQRMPTLFLSHGSPMLAIADSAARRFLGTLGERLPRPESVVIFSAHHDGVRRKSPLAADWSAFVEDDAPSPSAFAAPDRHERRDTSAVRAIDRSAAEREVARVEHFHVARLPGERG